MIAMAYVPLFRLSTWLGLSIRRVRRLRVRTPDAMNARKASRNSWRESGAAWYHQGRTSLLLVLLFLTPSASAATLYVDGNLTKDLTDGTYAKAARAAGGHDGSAYRTVPAALKAAKAGDRIEVRAGLYTGAVNLQGLSGITIAAYAGETPRFTTSVPVTGWSRCSSADPNLRRGSWTHPHAAQLWRVVTADRTICLHEAGRKLPLASDPNMTRADWYRVAAMRDVPNEGGNFGQDAYLVDTKHLNPAAGFYTGAELVVWSHGANNALLDAASIAASAGGKLTLAGGLGAALTNTGSLPDRYVIQNAPVVLDAPGEWCTVALAGGRYALYLWPRSEADLSALIRRNPATNAYVGGGACFYATAGAGGANMTLDGLTIENSLGGVEFTDTTGDVNNLTIHNVTVREGRGYGLYLYHLAGGRVADCNLEGSTSRSIQLGACRNTVLERNRIERSFDSAIITAGCRDLILTDNTIGETGNHGNGIAVYLGSQRILVARNTVRTTNVSFAINDAADVWFYANLVDKPSGASGIADWGGCSGQVAVWNNTFLGCNALAYGPGGSSGTSKTTLTIANNIMAEATFTGAALHQGNVYFKTPRFTLDPSEQLADPNATLTAAYGPRPGGPAAARGVNPVNWVPRSAFPAYDFASDHDNQPWGATLDVGAFRLASAASPPPPLPASLPDLDVDVVIRAGGVTAVGRREGTATDWHWRCNGLVLPPAMVTAWAPLPALP